MSSLLYLNPNHKNRVALKPKVSWWNGNSVYNEVYLAKSEIKSLGENTLWTPNS